MPEPYSYDPFAQDYTGNTIPSYNPQTPYAPPSGTQAPLYQGQGGLKTAQTLTGAAGLIPGLQVPAAIGTLALGALQTYLSTRALNKLQKQPMPNYSITPYQQHSYNRAEQNAQFGFSPAERNNVMMDINRSNNQSYMNAIDRSGGNQGQAITAGINFGNLRALTDLAAKDAQLKRSNIRYADQVGQGLTQQTNMITNQNINNRIRKEQAYGQGLQAGTGNIARGLDANQLYNITKNLYSKTV